MKRLYVEKSWYKDKEGRDYFTYVQTQKPDRVAVEAETRAELSAKYSVDSIQNTNLEDCSVDQLKEMLAFLKREPNPIAILREKIHAVYEDKVTAARMAEKIDKMSDTEKEQLKKYLNNV